MYALFLQVSGKRAKYFDINSLLLLVNFRLFALMLSTVNKN
jgi:hypothetical protein